MSANNEFTEVEKLITATAKGIFGAVPFLGPLLSEYIGLAQSFVGDSRMEDWMHSVETRLDSLKEQYSIEDLAQNGFFYSCVQTATAGAMRCFQQEKRQYFANALFNSAVLDLAQDKKMFFFNMLDRQTLGGIHLLKYYSTNHYDSEKYIHRSSHLTSYSYPGTEYPIKLISSKNTEFCGDTDHIKFITEQLFSDGFIGLIDFNTPESHERILGKHTTQLGDEFLKFISGQNTPEE